MVSRVLEITAARLQTLENSLETQMRGLRLSASTHIASDEVHNGQDDSNEAPGGVSIRGETYNDGNRILHLQRLQQLCADLGCEVLPPPTITQCKKVWSLFT